MREHFFKVLIRGDSEFVEFSFAFFDHEAVRLHILIIRNILFIEVVIEDFFESVLIEFFDRVIENMLNPVKFLAFLELSAESSFNLFESRLKVTEKVANLLADALVQF